MFNVSTIELSAEALRANLAFIRHLVGKGPALCTVVKGNAYGHGIGTFSGLAQDLGADRFAVYSAAEAYELKQQLHNGAGLYIMGDVDGPGLDWAVKHDVSFNVFERARLSQAIKSAQAQGKRALIHLEVETGMHRTGFALEELPQVLETCRLSGATLEVAGICSHFAGAESRSNHLRIQGQQKRFKEALAVAERAGMPIGRRHLACSAGLLNVPGSLYDMVRVGILHYGFWPNDETRLRFCHAHGLTTDPLKRVIRWWSRVMSVSTVPAGSFIGYGNSFQAQAPARIATIPMGYAYGYSRSLSNAGHVLVRGQKAPVRGIVNMNCITVDVTGIDGVEKGDEAVLIGSQGGNSISVASFGDLSDQLNYELLTRLPAAIPRMVVDKHP